MRGVEWVSQVSLQSEGGQYLYSTHPKGYVKYNMSLIFQIIDIVKNLEFNARFQWP